MRKTTVQLEPMSYAMTEEMKTLRTNILFCGNDKKVITVTSCVMGEGKTKISIRLATSLVELKKRVLLIDADLRKSVMASRLKATGADKGLTHILENKRRYYDDIYDKDSSISYIKDVHFERENDNYWSGLEYLSSIILLSRCDALVGGNCGGTLGAIFFNDEKYEFTHVFDLGLYP